MTKKKTKGSETEPTAEELRRWAESPEGQERLAEAKRRSRERSKAIRDSHRVDREILRIPMTK